MSSVDSWEPPANQPPKEIDPAVLTLFIDAISQADAPLSADALPVSELDDFKYIVTLHKDLWAKAASNLADTSIIALIHFFTLVEAHPGWEAGSKSPVVWLCRELKQRGLFPDKELIQWIKANTDNKFLPYGNPLDF